MPYRIVRLRLVSLLVIAGVALVYAWPLASRLTTAMPGTSGDLDVATFVWNVGWTRDALDHGYDILHTDTVLIPFGADLRLHTYGLLQGLMAYIPQELLGVVGAFNLIVLTTLWLNGVAAYALVEYETGDGL